MRIRTSEHPAKIRPFVALGFTIVGINGEEYFGGCTFCGKEDRFYVNQSTGQWDCKRCGKKGNTVTFLTQWLKECREKYPLNAKRLGELARNRSLSVESLLDAGIFWDGTEWGFPVLNKQGNVINLRKFETGGKLKGLPGIGVSLWGVEDVRDSTQKISLVEGEWDRIALRQLILASDASDDLESGKHVVLCNPGAGIWKADWNAFTDGCDLDLLFDNDRAGEEGMDRVAGFHEGSRKIVRRVQWPSGLPTGFDVRDLFITDGTYEMLMEFTHSVGKKKAGVSKVEEEDRVLPEGERPIFEAVVQIYSKWLYMTSESERVLKVIYAVILSNQLNGDPLWMHIVGTPGSGKTELLMSCSMCDQVAVASSVTPHSLVSGFMGGKDPSLIPQIINKVFILKDFTEILQMPKAQKDEVYSIFRGAYDGEVKKTFGNNVVRHYHGYFSMLTGVTHAIDGENSSTLGERFLKYRMKTQKDRSQVTEGDTSDQEKLVLEAIRNVGRESFMKEELTGVAADFLNREIDPATIPDVPLEYLVKLVALAEIVALLRTTVERGQYDRDRINYRPQPETPSRIAKQLKRLLLGLSIVNTPAGIRDEDYGIVRKCALDSCILFNLEVVRHLIKSPGQAVADVAKACNIPTTTLRECLDNMALIGLLVKKKSENPAGRGAPVFKWSVSDYFLRQWKKAGTE